MLLHSTQGFQMACIQLGYHSQTIKSLIYLYTGILSSRCDHLINVVIITGYKCAKL